MGAPLASVLAMGLVTSMVYTLLVVPVLYVVVERRRRRPASAAAAHAQPAFGAMHPRVTASLLLLAALGLSARAATAQDAASGSGTAARLTLDEAVATALRANGGVRVARSRAEEAMRRRQGAGRAMLPSLSASFQSSQSTGNQRMVFPAGALGTYSGTGPIPARDMTVEQGGQRASYGTLSISQPLTSLLRIRAGRDAARADERAALADARRAELDVALGVEKVYYGLLVARYRRRAAQLRLAAAEESAQHRAHAVSAGTRLSMAALEGRTAALDARQSLLAAEDEIADLSARLAELLGAPVDTARALEAPPAATEATLGAAAASPDVEEAAELLRKAEAGLEAQRATYIPDVSLYGQEVYQTAVPFLAKTNLVFGVRAEWAVFDFGRREANVAGARAARRTAEENLARVRLRVATEVEQARRKVQRASRQAALASEVLALRREAARIAEDRVATGVALRTEQREAEAAAAGAEADWLGAEVGRRVAVAELRRALGAEVR
jgi:outer membrane protein TolC